MTINERLNEIINELSAFDEFDLDASLQSDLGIDSLGMVALLVAIEDEFNIQLDESDMNPSTLLYVKDVLALVEAYWGKDNASSDTCFACDECGIL